MATIVTTPLVVAPADKFPVVPVANGILPDEALAITCNLQFNSTTQAILIDLSESTRKFNTVPIQGAFIDTSGSTIDLRVENSVTGQSVLAKAGLQGYYNLLIPMPAKLIAVLASAPAAQLNITMILYNTVIESEVWGFTTVAGPAGPQGPIGPAGPTGPQGPAGAGAPPATTTALGSVIVGSNLNVQTDGTLSVPVATTTVAGVVKAGTNVSVAGDGTISVPPTAAFQTPWLSNINALSWNLSNVSAIGIGTTASASNPLFINVGVSGLPMAVANTNATGAAGTTYINDQGIQMAIGVGGSARPATQERSNGVLNVFPSGNLVFELNNAEQMRLSATGLTCVNSIGIGTVTPAYRLDVRGTISAGFYPQLHLSVTDVDSGGYLLSGAPDQVNITGGASATSTGWQAKAVNGQIMQMGGGNIDFYTDTGLTAGASYTPTFRMRLNNTGLGVGTGAPLYELDVRTPGSTASQVHITNSNTDDGAYLNTTAPANFNISAGAAFNGISWIAKSNLFSSAAYFYNGIVQFACDNTGLTAGNAFTPTTRMAITPTGVALGTGTSPAHQLELSLDSAAKPSTNTWTISSGAKVKRHVKRLQGGLEIINKLRPTEAEYNGRGGTPEGQRVVSLIAEEVREILPHTVTEDADGNLGFNIHEVIHHLILSVQQLSAELERHKPVSRPKKAVA